MWHRVCGGCQWRKLEKRFRFLTVDIDCSYKRLFSFSWAFFPSNVPSATCLNRCISFFTLLLANAEDLWVAAKATNVAWKWQYSIAWRLRNLRNKWLFYISLKYLRLQTDFKFCIRSCQTLHMYFQVLNRPSENCKCSTRFKMKCKTFSGLQHIYSWVEEGC